MEKRIEGLIARLWRHQWAVVGVMAMTAFISGIVGLYRLQLEKGTTDPWSWASAIYFSLRLFGFNYDLGGEGSIPYAAGNWQLWLAGFLAPASTALAAFKVVTLSLASRFSLWRMSHWKGHAVVCGAGERGRKLALSLRNDNRRVVVIEKDGSCDTLEDLRRGGVQVIVGSVTDPATQTAARLDTAGTVVALTSCPEANLRVVLAASRRDNGLPLRGMVCAPRSFAAMFEGQAPFGRIEDGVECGFFDDNASAARVLVNTYAQRIATKMFREQRAARIVVAGDGEVVPELLGVLVAQCHFTSRDLPHVTVLTPSEDAVARGFPLRHPQLPLVAEVKVVELPVVRMLMVDLKSPVPGGSEPSYDLIFAACREDADTLALATHLARQNRGGIVVAGLAPSTSLHRLFGVTPELPGVEIQNLVDLACESRHVLTNALDVQAKRIHDTWLESELAQGKRIGETLALQRWEQLRDDFRQGNRSPADHAGIKRLILRESDSPDTVERLAEAEHRRWMADRILRGWRFGDPRDDGLLLHDCIRPYDELSESNKRKDRAAVDDLMTRCAGDDGGRP